MAIYNKDGSVFQTKGAIKAYDPSNPAIDLLNSYNAEAIKMGGSPLYYYEVLIQMNTVDRLYIEDRGKLFATEPKIIYGLYEPLEQKNASGMFGIDGMGEVMFECNYASVIEIIGKLPIRGSRIYTPHLQENWIIVDVKLTQFNLWSAFHVNITCERFQESLTTMDGEVTKNKPYEIV